MGLAIGAVGLVTEIQPWPQTGKPRRAGGVLVRGGAAGTNAHAILAEASPSRAGARLLSHPGAGGNVDCRPATAANYFRQAAKRSPWT